VNELEKHKRAFELFCRGLHKRQIAQALGVSVGTVTYWASAECKCSCGFHNWSERKELAQFETEDCDDLSSELESAESAVVSADLVEFRGLLGLMLTTLKQQIENGDIKPRTWTDLLETLKLMEKFKEFLPDNKRSPEVHLSKQTDVKIKDFSPAELDRFADLFLKRHVVGGAVPHGAELESKEAIDISESDNIDSMLEELTKLGS